MNNQLGIMQGRLSPRSDGRYQSHPVLHWQSEFFIAQTLRLQLVEFILDTWSLEYNPLLSEEGIAEIKHITQRSGVEVNSICADVFMDCTFARSPHNHDAGTANPEQAISLLEQCIHAAVELNIRDIVIPCVDRSSLPCIGSQTQFIERIAPLCERANNVGVRVNIESDWAPDMFAAVLDAIGRDRVWVNYDTGNSSSLGYDPREEFAAYGANISDFHIKDRLKGGASVELGTGDADFDFILRWLQTEQFEGQLIFQAARGDHFVDDLALVRSQVEWFKRKWQQVSHG